MTTEVCGSSVRDGLRKATFELNESGLSCRNEMECANECRSPNR